LGSVLDVLPRDGALFVGRTGAVPLPDGRVLVVSPTEAHIVLAVEEPPDNAIPAPADGLRVQRPAWMPFGISAAPVPEDAQQAFRRIWARRHEQDAYIGQEPYTGGLIRAAQALRQASARQEQPAALAFRLQTPDPGDPKAAYLLVKALEGLADAARMFRLPLVAGELTTAAVDPELEVAAYTADAQRYSSAAEAEPAMLNKGEDVYLLGRTTADLSGSLYAGGQACFPPPIDLVVESRVQEIAAEIGHAMPLGRGGLLITLARCCVRAGTGARLAIPTEPGWLFGEAQSRMLFFLPRERSDRLLALAAQLDIPIERLGTLGGVELIVEGAINLDVRELT